VGLTVQLAGLAKTYNSNRILKDCSYTFAAGETYVLMGDNGTGKSTLLRIAALLEAPDRGEVRYFEAQARLAPDIHLKRRLTMVFPRVGVFSRSVFDNVAYGLRIRGLQGDWVRKRVARVLEEVGLTHKSAQPATTLSSGETMRLGLARALAIDPEVLFLDEPTTHIDRANTRLIEDCIGRLRQEGALTLIIVTHDQAQAERLGGRQLLLEEGRLRER
jgi:tungstate transport system ATP-binding protein